MLCIPSHLVTTSTPEKTPLTMHRRNLFPPCNIRGDRRSIPQVMRPMAPWLLFGKLVCSKNQPIQTTIQNKMALNQSGYSCAINHFTETLGLRLRCGIWLPAPWAPWIWSSAARLPASCRCRLWSSNLWHLGVELMVGCLGLPPVVKEGFFKIILTTGSPNLV